MDIIFLIPIFLVAIAIICFFAWMNGDDNDALLFCVLSLLCAFFALIQGVVGYEAAKREAVATGNAYYKQIVNEEGNVRNEFHWRVEKEKEKKCDCETCKADK